MTENFCTEYWIAQVGKLEQEVGTPPSSDFLSNEIIRHTMYADDPNDAWPTKQLDAVVDYFGYDFTVELSKEPDFGGPTRKTYQSKYGPVISSHNNIQHMYHIVNWLKVSRVGFLNGVVEWGGGFGNMARLFKKIFDLKRYTIVDLPYMNTIQSAYFDSIQLDVDVTASADSVGDLPADSLFISTWALSECNESAIDFIVKKDFYKAHHLLLAAQKPDERFKSAGSLESAASRCFFDPVIIQFRDGYDDIYLLQ